MESANPSPRSGKRTDVALFGIIALVVAVCWTPGLNAFFDLDDFILLEGSSTYWRHAPGFFSWVHTVFFHNGFIDYNYRPLSTHIVFLTMQSLFGQSPVPFHVLSVLLHLFVCVAIFGMLRRMGLSREAALLAAVFYATRDALFGAVAWISGVQDGLMTAFAAAAMWALVEAAVSHRPRWRMVSLICMLGALFSKESAVVLPVLASAMAWAASAGNTRKGRLRSALSLTWGHWALWMFFCVFRLTEIGVRLRQYALGFGDVFWFRPGSYAFWTAIAGYQWAWRNPSQHGLFVASALLGWAVIAAAAWLIWRHRKSPHGPLLAASGLWWAIGVAFVTLQVGRFQMYYLSLPAVGAALFVGAWLETIQSWPRVHARRMAWVTGLIIVEVGICSTMNALKRNAKIPIGSYYSTKATRANVDLLQNLNTISNGLSNRKRVIFINFIDMQTTYSDPDDTCYRQASAIASMLRVMSKRPDLQVYYALTPGLKYPPRDIAPENVVDLAQILAAGPRADDLIVGRKDKQSPFVKVAIAEKEKKKE